MIKNDSIGFKAFARHVQQLNLSNSRYIEADLQTAIIECRKAQIEFSDKLFILENLLDAAREAEE